MLPKVDRVVYNQFMQYLSLAGHEKLSAKERILETAHKLFYQDGIRATGVDRMIAESSVTKTTFYRHFKSKNNLIIAYLEQRHQRLIQTFGEGLQQNGGDAGAIVLTVKDWFESEDFRGCAFLNSVGEIGAMVPEVIEITQKHKQEMAELFETVLTESPDRAEKAKAIALAVDGATVQAQFSQSSQAAIHLLNQIVEAITTQSNI